MGGDELPFGGNGLGHSFEIRASFSTVAGVSFGVHLLASADGSERTAIGISTARNVAFVDKRNSTHRDAVPPVFKDLISADHSVALYSIANVTIYVDGHVVEAFFDGKVISSLVYPNSVDSTRMGLFLQCTSGEATV